MIDWHLAWQTTAVAFGFTFTILFLLSIITRLFSAIIGRLPGHSEGAERQNSNNNATAAGE
jgi:Na+-transporting methylmalonyl-CoA/oxaloacetate decarboxylase gamma subunit